MASLENGQQENRNNGKNKVSKFLVNGLIAVLIDKIIEFSTSKDTMNGIDKWIMDALSPFNPWELYTRIRMSTGWNTNWGPLKLVEAFIDLADHCVPSRYEVNVRPFWIPDWIPDWIWVPKKVVEETCSGFNISSFLGWGFAIFLGFALVYEVCKFWPYALGSSYLVGSIVLWVLQSLILFTRDILVAFSSFVNSGFFFAVFVSLFAVNIIKEGALSKLEDKLINWVLRILKIH